MKIVINHDYGGYGLSQEAFEVVQKANFPKDIRHCTCRTSPTLINYIYEHGSKAASAEYATLAIANIPDDATDWYITEYDGQETLLYVLNGKIYICDDIEYEDEDNG